jgi:hypothetical protein
MNEYEKFANDPEADDADVITENLMNYSDV